MSFEIVQPGKWSANPPLESGQCSIRRDGQVTFFAADLEDAGIEHYLIALADPSTRRIAVRAVDDGEQAMSLAVSIDNARVRRARLTQAFRRLGFDGDVAKGRYVLAKHGSMLIINLGDKLGDDAAAADSAEADEVAAKPLPEKFAKPAAGTRSDPHAAKPRFGGK